MKALMKETVMLSFSLSFFGTNAKKELYIYRTFLWEVVKR